MKKSEEKYRSVVESSVDYIYMLDLNGTYLSANNKFLSQLGLSAREVVGKTLTDIFIHSDINEFFSKFRETINTNDFVTYEYHNEELDKWFLTTLSPVHDPTTDSVTAVAVVSKDITERKRSEERLRAAYTQLKETQNQLIQSEKMTALGKLASGIAHEIRNPLGVIVMGIDFLTGSHVAEDDETKTIIRSINSAVSRTNAIIGATMEFSRSSKLKFENLNVGEVLDEAASVIKQGTKKKNISFNRNYADQDIRITGDRQMLKQAFFNIMLNSVDAMPDGGEITLRAYTKLAQKTGFQVGYRDNDYFRIGDKICVVEIEDTGCGISPKIMPKIFDPFFTTKEIGSGTGLGLSIVHLIIDRHSGVIDVKSTIDKGTKFIIYLNTEQMSYSEVGNGTEKKAAVANRR